MEVNPILMKALKENRNQITTAQIQKLGFSRTMLFKYVENGLLVRIGRGVYTLPDSVVDDMYLLQQRSDKIIFSHDTALFLNHLSDRTPFIHSITIPSNASVSRELKEECICYYIKPELHLLGVEEKATTFGNSVRCYNPERTLCDFLRSRNRCDEEMVLNAIKNYMAYKKKDLNRLAGYADAFRVSKILRKYMEVLL